MSIPPLTIIPAGAGSGKTFTIQQKLAEWVIAGKVAPDRIVAVTFTEAAAAELRDRIRNELVARDRLEDALKLEQSYISTIHGFGLRVLTEYAFDRGISPAPRLLNEDEQEILTRRALAETDRTDGVIGDLYAHGYSYDHNSGKGAEDLFRDRVFHLIGMLRSIGLFKEDQQVQDHALSYIRETYGTTINNTENYKGRLHTAVKALLKEFPESFEETDPTNDSATGDFRQNFSDLREAEKGYSLDSDWGLWQRLRKIRTSCRGAKLPDRYKELAGEVMEAAAAILTHPGPLEHYLTHASSLLGGSMDSLDRYAADKCEKGLLDYTDMLVMAHDLLANNSRALDALKGRVDCLVIDEFQDTNPIQFSLLWELHKAGIPTLIVGDLKQAIMRFQNADSRLLAELQEKNADNAKPLTSNWRSTPALMEWVNRVGAGLFKEKYISLEPKADFPSSLSPLEAISFSQGGRENKVAVRIQHTVARIKALLDDETQVVYDRKLGKVRRLRGGDIAILCPTNGRLPQYAKALSVIGIRSRIEQSGWFETRILQLLYHALSYVADQDDRHAALYLAVTELGGCDLQSALEEATSGGAVNDELLNALDGVIKGVDDKSIKTLIAEVIEALDLHDLIANWPDAAQARANLLRLQGEADEFLNSNREALASGGYYGTGLKTFLSWLKDRAERDNSQPEPKTVDEDSIQIMTWHKSKGREWPIVAVCSLDSAKSVRLPSFDVVYEDFSDLGAILDKARVEISPDSVIPEKKEAFKEPLEPQAWDDALRVLYVALTRAREKLILECPVWLKEGGSTYWHVLKAETGLELKGNRMIVGGEEFDCRVVETTTDPPPEFEDVVEQVEMEKLPVMGRRAIEVRPLPEGLIPETVSPSSLHGEIEGTVPAFTDEVKRSRRIGTVPFEVYGNPLDMDLALSAADRGTLLHRAFEVLSGAPEKKAYLKEAVGYGLKVNQIEEICQAVAAFDEWVEKKFSPVSIGKEVPFLSLDDNNSVVSGTIDMLIETETGFWIIDHKSDQTDDLEERFATYLPQLECYAEAVRKARLDKPVLGVGVNWVSNNISMILSM